MAQSRPTTTTDGAKALAREITSLNRRVRDLELHPDPVSSGGADDIGYYGAARASAEAVPRSNPASGHEYDPWIWPLGIDFPDVPPNTNHVEQQVGGFTVVDNVDWGSPHKAVQVPSPGVYRIHFDVNFSATFWKSDLSGPVVGPTDEKVQFVKHRSQVPYNTFGADVRGSGRDETGGVLTISANSLNSSVGSVDLYMSIVRDIFILDPASSPLYVQTFLAAGSYVDPSWDEIPAYSINTNFRRFTVNRLFAT